ncbi:MAG: DUF4442 domain-containing protein [Bacteroidetes bacterium]|nr:DUF4442 domain-containing protein [Bacteroidota bacterium]
MKKTAFLRYLNQPLRFSFYLLLKLPAAWFMGMRVRTCDEKRAEVALPYHWRSQNPFKSTYFAAQCAAGELSTGLLGLVALQDKPPVSMLVTEVRAEFYKKADKTLIFTCSQGDEVAACVTRALANGTGETIVLESSGTLPNGELASRVWITWSFKAKAPRLER